MSPDGAPTLNEPVRGRRDLLTKRNTFVLLVVPSLLLLLLTTRTWATGRTSDAVLGPASVAVTGSQAAPGVVALAAVALAALVAVFTGGRRIRRVSAVLLTLAAAGAVLLTAQFVVSPATAVGAKAARQLARSGAVAAEASTTPIAWVALATTGALLLAGVVGIIAVGHWEGLSSRFDRPTAPSDERGAHRSAWDDLSEGNDPTIGPEQDRT